MVESEFRMKIKGIEGNNYILQFSSPEKSNTSINKMTFGLTGVSIDGCYSNIRHIHGQLAH